MDLNPLLSIAIFCSGILIMDEHTYRCCYERRSILKYMEV